ncbi:hypothetical protein M3Y97_00523200 [Aphelenchoides bicaudatus]|nr:hypothetical protein M3Y97_00523200 [Aphelenchoides bicaudatus]
MQNIFPPLLSIQQPQVQPPQMALQPDQDSPPNLELLMSTLAQQQNSASSSSSGIPNQLFEAIFANALSQSQGLNNLSHLDQAHLNSSDQSSPPISALAEDTSTVVSTPTSAVPTSVQQVDEDAANKFMAQLLRDAPANLLQQLPGQSQPTSPNLQDASQLLEQLQFMGLLTGNNGQGMPDQTETKKCSRKRSS